MQYYNHDLDIKHGEVIRSAPSNQILFRYRCGPAPRHCSWSWPLPYRKGHQGKVRKTWGRYHHPKTLNSLRMAEVHELDGIHVRYKSNKNLPTSWDDYRSYPEKSWKSHRDFQYS